MNGDALCMIKSFRVRYRPQTLKRKESLQRAVIYKQFLTKKME